MNLLHLLLRQRHRRALNQAQQELDAATQRLAETALPPPEKCPICGALVLRGWVDSHLEWHRTLAPITRVGREQP